MIRDHMGLAQSLAQQVWRSAPHALELEELRAIAHLGLVDAAARWRPYCHKNQFDPARIEYFKPYVARRVYGELMDEIRRRDYASRSLRTKARALQEAGQDRGLSEAQLAERSGMSIKEVRATVRGMAQRPVSLEAEELDLDARQDVESCAFTSSVLDSVVVAIRALGEDQQVVIALHYFRGLQLQQIAREMGITESHASQLHAHAVTAVHAAMVYAAQAKDD
jgi:RNA polymerase sigma factor for flagellar operon FliA